MKIVSKILKRSYLSRSLIYFLTWCMVINTTLPLAIALEAVDVTGSTGVIGTTWGDHTIIDTDHGAIVDWSNFNTNSTQSITFNQYLGGDLSSVSAVLNRVSSGAVPTQFNGALNANGRVFVVNPAGVIFGAGSLVNVSQLVASGLNMSDDAFGAVLADSSNRMAFEGGQGEVRNLGSISADSVYLIGKKVTNLGSIKAPDGLVVMAAGDNVYLGQDGSNLVVELNAEALDPGADVRNSGLVSADNGKIVLAAGDSFSGAVSNVGVLAASAGEVTVDAARVESSGLITAGAADGDGGNINITAAEEIVLGADSRTTANAGLNGSGGNVILKSEGTTVVSQGAAIEARGGSESGDGGFVEVSGEHFVLAGDIDTSAQNGAPGTVFIDPLDVTIAGGANVGAMDTVYEDDIQDHSQAGMNVLVEAQNSITVEDISDGEITGGAGDISLRTTGADSSIIFVDKDDAITTTLGDIVIEAGGDGIDIGSLMTGSGLSGERVTPGRITVTTVDDGDIITKDLFISPGAGRARIYVDASGNLTIEGDVSIGTPGDPILDIPGGLAAEATIHLSADDNVILDGDVGAYADGRQDYTTGAVTRAYIKIFAGENGTPSRDVTIRADLAAYSKALGDGESQAHIEIGATDNVYFGPDAAAPVADAGNPHAEGYTGDKDSKGGKIAQIIIKCSNVGPEPQSKHEHGHEPHPENKHEPHLIIDSRVDQPKHKHDHDPHPDHKPDPDPDPDVGTGAGILEDGPELPTKNLQRLWQQGGKRRYQTEDETAEATTEQPALLAPVAPIGEEVELEYSGCPALTKWAAAELGVDEKKIEIAMTNSLASARGIQPCDTCARLKEAATVLRDNSGLRVAALARVISEFTSSAAPPSEEQDASIIAAILNNDDANSHYVMAGEYLDSLTAYVGTLSSEMDFSITESVIFAADRYVAPLAERNSDNVGLTAFLVARLTALSES